mmetsp:Transcript_46818/g.136246  ORF Transcript_46818/g.136246 Transcript_46818/m.136246 type:complete len:201 (-) Transcript_46818:553-1155(-)
MPSIARFPCFTPRANMMMSRLLAHACSKICALAVRQCGLIAVHAVNQIPPLAWPLLTSARYCSWNPWMIMLSRLTALSGSMPKSLATKLTTVVFPAQDGPTSTMAFGVEVSLEGSTSAFAACIMASFSSCVKGRNKCFVKSKRQPLSSLSAATTAGSSSKGSEREWPSILACHSQTSAPQGDDGNHAMLRRMASKLPTTS